MPFFKIIIFSLSYQLLMSKSLEDINTRAVTEDELDDENDLFDISYKNNTIENSVNLETFLELILNTAKIAEEGVEVSPNIGVKNKNIGDLSSWLFYPGMEYSFLRSPGRWRGSGTRRMEEGGRSSAGYQAVVLQIPNL